VDPDQINRILELKRIPLTISMTLSHYLLGIIMVVIGCFCIYKFIWNDLISGAEGFLVIGIPCILLALYIFFYLGKKQLKLKKVQLHFEDDKTAYIIAKEVFAFYKWDIMEENGINYIKALRADSFFGVKSPWKGRAISIFIKQGNIFVISLYTPDTRADIFGINASNVILFEQKIKELSSNNRQP